MADQNAPNSGGDKNRDKAEGERWNPEQEGASRRPSENDPSQRYDGSDEGSGITNRPLDEEIENQQALPERGNTRDEEERTSDSDRGNDQ